VKTLLLIASEKMELGGLLRHARGESAFDVAASYARRAEFADRRYLLVANGPGPKLAAEAVRAALGAETVDAIVSTGFCGGLDPSLRAGDLVCGTRILDCDADEDFEAPAVEGWRPVRMTCGDRVIQTAKEKRRLRERTGADAVDMESAAIAREARRHAKPFFCLRIVTDTAGEDFANDFNASRDSEGRFAKGAVVRRALARPLTRLPELLRLSRIGRELAIRLGDGLAACQF
jgi:adenosylhomocysteine nucleosidase